MIYYAYNFYLVRKILKPTSWREASHPLQIHPPLCATTLLILNYFLENFHESEEDGHIFFNWKLGFDNFFYTFKLQMLKLILFICLRVYCPFSSKVSAIFWRMLFFLILSWLIPSSSVNALIGGWIIAIWTSLVRYTILSKHVEIENSVF